MAVININPPPGALYATYEELFTDTNADAGLNEATFTAVPAGEVHVIEGACSWNATRAIARLALTVVRGAVNYTIASVVPSAAYVSLQLYTPLTLFPGDALMFSFVGCTAGDDIYARAVGVKYGIELF